MVTRRAPDGDGWKNERAHGSPVSQPSCSVIDSASGGLSTPFSVTMAVTFAAGVTSNAAL